MQPTRTLLYENEESIVYLEVNGESKYIRKMLRSTSPDPESIVQLNNEYDFTADLSIPGIRHALTKEKSDQFYSITLEYIDGHSLQEAFVEKRQPLENILEAFIDLSLTLGELHEKGIIHKDVNPKNIIWDTNNKTPVIIDFGISSRIDVLATNLGNPDKIKGTLAYISPEQTGRVNRKVDNRSDLYSLGITLFQVLTGKLPFESSDSLELVHFHIAKSIPLVHRLNPEVPEIISFIVSRLLAKNAEDRYQTAYGLKADLERCQDQLKRFKKIENFDLGEEDFSGKFQIPQKLYGRYDEIKTLLKAYDRVSRGSTELFLVAGYSGIGKSALVSELYKPITERRGYFIGGKFDQYQKNIPFYAITQAFEEFCNLLLTERKEKLEYWKSLITQSLGENAQVLVDIIPGLTTLIGPQPAVAKLENQEALNRFQMVFLQFVRAISKPEHPMVFFFDDLQWADVGSLQMIRLMVTDTRNPYLLVLGAYRDNEITPGHPLTAMLDELQKEKAVVNAIALSPLKEEHVFQIIKESLNLDDTWVHDLTEIVYAKTKGNAFFTLEFLKALHQQQLVKYDFSNRKWLVDMDGIRKKDITSNVVELLVSKIEELPAATAEALKMASCIGGIFDLQLLCELLNQDASQTMRDLWPALEDELLNPTNDKFQFIDVLDDDASRKAEFTFVHDRIQQAAYTLVDTEEAEKIHLKIGRLLLTRKNGKDEVKFALVNHYNGGIKHIETDEEKRQLAKLNLKAATQAKESSAYSAAHMYIDASMSLAGDNVWQSDYPFALQLFSTAADVEYLVGNFEESEKLIATCLANAQTPADKAEIYFLLMQNQNNNTRYYEAIDSARQGLKLLDFVFPEKDDCPAMIPGEMGKVITWFAEHGVGAVYEQPDMTDARLLSIIKILDNLSPPTYVTGEANMWILQVLLKVNLTLSSGLTPQGGYAFSELGLTFFIMSNYQYADPAAQMSMRIVEKFAKQSPRHLSRAGHLYSNYNTPWVKHINESLRLNSEYYQRSLESGELVFAGYTSFHPFYVNYYQGKETLKAMVTKLPDALVYTRQIHHDLAHDSLRAMNLCLANLQGRTANEFSFDIAEDSEQALLQYCQEVKDGYGLTMFYLLKAHALYLHGFFKEADESLKVVAGLTAVLAGNAPTSTLFNMLQSLLLLHFMSVEAGDLEAMEKQVEANQQQMKIWADQNATNFEHKYLLVEAERKRYKNEFSRETIDLYHKAIKSAEANEFYRELAVIHLRAADYWFGLQQSIYALPHIEKARYLLQSMGYERMLKQMDATFGKHKTERHQDHTTTLKPGAPDNTADVVLEIGQLDLKSVMKAANALSEEIVLESLLEKMLRIVIENAGAQRAVLVLPQKNSWKAAADLNLNNEDGLFIGNLELDQAKDIPVSIINYVIRTNAEVISADESMKKMFERDDHLRKQQPASFFCIPLQYKGVINAILYVEHATASNAFTPERLSLIKLLTSQMAVSLENASLYNSQSELNKAYQRFVPHDFIKTLGHESILDVKLGDNIDKEMTILFCDVRSYTTLSESLSPQESFELINSYLSFVGPVIKEFNGFINHYLGDGFIALFKNGPEDALRAALKVNDQMLLFNEKRLAEGAKPIALGMGLHTGRVMMGIIGDAERHDANVMSDAVNVASRLEGLTKLFGAQLVISDMVLKGIPAASHFNMRFLGRIRLKGKEEVINVHEVFNTDGEDVRNKKLKTVDLYNEGLKDYFDKHFAEAAVSLKRVLDQNVDDKTARRYLQNAAKFMVEGVPDNWDGVEQMIEK